MIHNFPKFYLCYDSQKKLVEQPRTQIHQTIIFILRRMISSYILYTMILHLESINQSINQF